MPASAQFALGIDLGTTNCALAAAPLGSAAASAVLPVTQWADRGQVVARDTLPSFLYRPHAADAEAFSGGPGLRNGWVVGLAARVQATRTPDRVVLSAKSWLASHARDASAALLPWKSETLAEGERIAPLAASSALLAHLREAWDAAHPEAPLADQLVTVTVPASFDTAAQEATRRAASEAGFPAGMRLLEEPQAAFYRWLEGASVAVRELAVGEHVLVVDVGGGTSDFSLFRVTETAAEGGRPAIERIAVSEHILLGGDNVDLALAHYFEAELAPDGTRIEGESWNHLVARAREAKEQALQAEDDAILRLAIPGRGSGLLAGTRAGEFSAAAVREIVLEGFFPLTPRGARPEGGRSALQEWGLPYASDFAVTRYLADFLREHPPIDAVLFNGGSLAAPLLRARLREQLGAWQDGRMPRVLENPETDLAVARGAAHYGALLAGRGGRIAAGAARAVFLEVAATDAGRRLLCVLPRGAQPEAVHRAAIEGLRVRVRQQVSFRAYQGAHRRNDPAGALVDWDPTDFAELPPLETTVTLAGEDAAFIPVALESQLNELGLLQVDLVARPPHSPERWPLAFNLRGADASAARPAATVLMAAGMSGSRAGSTSGPEVDVESAPVLDQAAALAVLERAFGSRRRGKGERLTSARLFKQLERRLGAPRPAWPLAFVRALGDHLLDHADDRLTSPEHLDTWLHLVGWCLRPGFGDPRDAARLDALWNLLRPAAFPVAKRTEPPYSLLWRRLADGLPGDRQQALADSRFELWTDPGRASPEGVRLAGALERLDRARKERLVEAFLTQAVSLARSDGHPAPYLAALGGLLSRVPRRAGAVILPPAAVEAAFARLAPLDWASLALAEIVPLFLRAARQVEDPALNLASRSTRRLTARLAALGLSPARLQPLRSHLPLSTLDASALYEEALPPGLMLDT